MRLLNRLLEDDFLLSAGAVSTAEGLLAYLERRGEVKELRAEYMSNAIGSSQIQLFVADLLATKFRAKQKFSGEIVIAAIAVALSRFGGKFPTEFIEKLSSLHIQEMPLAPKIAALLLEKRRVEIPDLTLRNFLIGQVASLERAPVAIAFAKSVLAGKTYTSRTRTNLYSPATSQITENGAA